MGAGHFCHRSRGVGLGPSLLLPVTVGEWLQETVPYILPSFHTQHRLGAHRSLFN